MKKPIPKYKIVEKKIKQAIRRGVITDKLPGERILAKGFGFSYMTIRKAIENLVIDGVLYKIPAKGTYVTDNRVKKHKTETIFDYSDNSSRQDLSSHYYPLIFDALEKETVNSHLSPAQSPDISEFDRLLNMKKVDLVQTIQLAEGNVSCFSTAIDCICDQQDCMWREDCFTLARIRNIKRNSETIKTTLDYHLAQFQRVGYE